MGYYSQFTGEIRIEPPLTWGEVKDSPWLSEVHGDLMLRVDSDVVEQETDEGVGSFTRKTVAAITPITDDSYKGYGVENDLQRIVDAFPGHSFTGYISVEGEEAGDLWRLTVKNGRATKVVPRIVWPDDTP